MMYTYENLRLMELATVADLNKPFFDDFKNYIISKGYESIFDFVSEEDDAAGYRTILDYMNRELPNGVILHDGIARPYNPSRAKWLFLGWLFRDAPEQRLRPMVSSMDGSTLNERRAALFNLIRKPLPTYFQVRATGSGKWCGRFSLTVWRAVEGQSKGR